MEEIASKWDTYSSVQQSGIATSLAGVRQRENVITLFENWDLVKKFEDISANAYGTAVEKMEAYSQGVEAARKRVQTAWEGFALVINESGALETAFNTLATAIENLHLIILSVIGALIINNPEAALGTLTTAFTKLGTFLNTRGLAGMLGSGKKDIFTKEFQENLRKQSAENAFVVQKQAMFGDYLGNFKGNLDNNRFAGMVEYQSGLIGLEKNASNAQFLQGLGALAGGINLKDTLKMGEGLRLLNSAVLTGEQAQIVLNTVTKEVSDALIKEKMAVAQGTTDEEKLAWARQAAAKDLLIDMTEGDKSKYYDENARRTFTAATGTGMRGNELEQREMQNRAYASMAGSVVGMYGAKTLMGSLAAGIGGEDARSAGESIGSVIGMFAGEKAASSLFTAIKGVMRGTMAKTALIAPAVGVAALVIGSIIGLVSAARKKEIEKAQNEFKELKDTYESQLTASTKVSRYDELAKRIDQFGRNVSLTDEDYSEFLSTSNELAELFPELVVRTDEAGNSFLGTAGKVGKLTESIEEMVKASQKAADQQLLSKDVFKTAFDEAKTEAQNKEHQLNSLRDLLNKQEQAVANGGVFEVTDSFGGPVERIEATEKDINNTKNAIANLEKELSQAGSSMTDWANAIVRNDENLQKTLNSLSEDTEIAAKQTMQNVFASINPADYKDWNEYESVIENLSNKIADVYKNNPRLVELEANRTGNAGEYFGNRKKILEDLVDSFGGYADLDESEKKILIGIGFEFDEDSQTWVDSKDTIRTIGREFGFRRTGKKNGITAENLGQLSTEDVDKVYGYLKSGEINKYTSMDTIVNMLYADREVPENIPIMSKYVETLSKQAEEAKNVLSNMSLDDWKAMDKDQLQKTFSNLPEAWRNGIKGIKDAIDNGDFGEDELKDKLDSLYQTLGSSVIDASSELAKLSLNKVFSASQLTDDIDGIVDSMSELQKALKAVAESYDALKEAQKEQNAHRKLSLSTVVDLLATNMNYAQVLEFETDAETGKTTAIRLAANAQQIMNQMQIDAIKANLEVAIANNELAIQEKQKQISLLKGETVTDSANKQTEDAITLTQVWGKVTTRIAKALARVVTLLGALKSGSSIKSALEQAENASNAISEWDDVEWVTKYQSMSRDERETAIQNLRDEIVDLQSENKTYRYTADNLNANNIGSELRGYVKNNDENAKKEFEDWLSALEGVYNKEFYLRKSLKEQGNLTAEGQDMYMSGAYYDKMRDVYTLQSKYYEAQLPKGKAITEYTKDQLAYYQKWQEVQVKINNLDDEQIEDKINILQLQDVSYDQLIAAQRELLATSDTLEEEISRRKEINNLIKQQIELQMDVQKWQREIADIALEYEKGTPDTSAYESLIAAKRTSLQADLDTIEARLNWIRYDQSDEAKQYRGSKEADQEIRDKTKQWLETYQELASIPLDVLNDKLDILEKKLDLLEKSKPNEWGAYDQIENYYSSNINYLEQKATLIREQLEDVSMLTDEQVQDLVDQLNDVTVALREAQINLLQDQKDYKDSQYDAIVSKVNEYKDEIQDAIDAIEKAYEEEVKPIQDVNDELERQAKLEDLLAAKKSLAREKERVYRSGIGWTYETPRDKRKENAKEIDDFYRQDRLDDLEKTKDAEIANLNERIEQWDLYLKALDWRYNEAQRIERDRLLAELFGLDQSMSNADLQKEIYDRIFNDMTEFNANCEGSYKEYIGIFSNFLQEYTALVLQLAELQRQALALMDSAQYLGLNNYENIPVPRGWTTLGEGTGGYGGGSSGSYGYASDYQAVINRILGEKSNYGSDGKLTADAKARVDALEKLRNEKIDSEGLSYDKTYGQSNAKWSGSKSSGGSSGKSSGSSGSYTAKGSNGDYTIGSDKGKNFVNNAKAGDKMTGGDGSTWTKNSDGSTTISKNGKTYTVGSHADGILGGPVTYTGLSMLHGTPTEPEYVLNSDQAYNLLRNLATTKLPEYTSTLSQDMGVSYVIQGDVVLENCDDPAQFWNQVMAATHNRYNVTKNKR